ncbi:SbcD DNA repair exonuclease [uncultured Caudovirales phage]|uniref:SbcD DNA repair exonuclease n=1 Tax=uncultured Caudovirales phage TaxID=2100421 RepID=A0A6J5PIB3_9CAUD|nr:SbcD DNA repair exonuclease [uncultured Caudovirales phage]CAB4181981.1 SbcD DNA repair exonuclease [uncultured Caudovirales phage]CAB4197524.1 SbcD DNA repair exonuclease [uncultured Caudovirales phage]CAB4211592.1 SbcD DNA repair exonuclease [uncultured Caudovirales phage]CAB5238705.1 SbcD DNA repair exonuclease [uncultured Caudovirales phage]
MKVAIITDQHFGARNDSIAFLDFFEKFYDNTFFPALDANSIDTVLVLGDTFDRRKYVNFYALDRAKKMFFDKLEERGIRVHMLAGNHDTYYKNTNEVNSPDLLLVEYGNIDVISKPETIVIDGTSICMMPWICPENYQESLDHITNTKAEICMGHFEIAGFAMHRGMESNDGLAKETFQKFDLVFSGHYHHRSSDKHIHYLGNPYELTWQDYNDPRGFHLFDLDTRELEFICNPYRMFERLEYNDKEQEPIDLDLIELEQKYVKLVVVNKNDFYKFDKFIQKLYNKGCHEIKIIEDMSEFQDGEIGEEINLEDTLSVLSHYVDSIETDVDKEQIKTYMRTLYTEAVNIEVV